MSSEIQIIIGIEHTELRQLHRHIPGVLPSGDCYRTAIACLLGATDPADVPHFVDLDGGKRWEFHRLARHWLRTEEGLDLCPVDLDVAASLDIAYMLNVQSQAGPWGHCVIAKAGEVIHCPSGKDYRGAAPDEPFAWVLTHRYDPDPDTQIAEWAAQVAAEEAAS